MELCGSCKQVILSSSASSSRKQHTIKVVKCSTRAIQNTKAYISETARCGADVILGENSLIAADVQIGSGSIFQQNFECDEGTTIGENVIAGKNVIIGKYVCVENGTIIRNGVMVPNWSKVKQIHVGSQELGIFRLQTGFKYVLSGGKCVAVQRTVAKDWRMLNCASVVYDNEYIDRSAACGPEVEIDHNSRIAANVEIGYGSDFGYNLVVDEGTRIGDFVYCGDRVHFGKFVCVENNLEIDDDTVVPDYSVVAAAEDGSLMIVTAARGMMYDLRDGLCVEVQR